MYPSSSLSRIDFSSKQAVPGNASLPVVYSTLDANALINLIREHFSVEPPLSCRLWHRGLSDVYLVETNFKPYILRITHKHWRKRADVEFEMSFLSYLAHHQLPVAAPLPSKQGSLVIAIQAPEGERYATLFPYAEGEMAIGDLNIKQSHHLGKILAQIHQASQGFNPIAHRQLLNLSYLLDESLQTIEPFFRQRSLDWQEINQAIALIKQQVKLLPTESPYWSICWGDPHSGNVHFTADNQPTLFDFDQCGYGWRVFDLAKFLQVSLQSGLCRSVRDALLAGYQSIEKLTQIELDCLHHLTQAAYIWSWAINVNNLSLSDHSRLSNGYFSRRLECFRRFVSDDWQ
jgi:Ser/Thr protein kinase RdoA (MazF antagonist)